MQSLNWKQPGQFFANAGGSRKINIIRPADAKQRPFVLDNLPPYRTEQGSEQAGGRSSSSPWPNYLAVYLDNKFP